MGKETELKLSLPVPFVPALRAHPLLQVAEPVGSVKTLDNTYFDTSDLKLHEQHVALRTRQQGDIWLQTVKCAAVSVGGLSQRPEWEKPYTGEFDFTDVELKPVRKILQKLQPQLQPVFTTLFNRETLFLRMDSGAEVLLMIDQGDILAQGKKLPLCELELELVSGQPEELLHLAIDLAETLPLLPSDISKAERGYKLFKGETEQPTKMPSVQLSKQQTPLSAFKSLAFACTAQWQGNVKGVASSDDPEFVHQLRISQRRLRALLRLFKPILPQDWFVYWNKTLADNARIFSGVRDLDVMSDELLPELRLLPETDHWHFPELHQLVINQRDLARHALMEHPDLQRQGRLILMLVTELHALELPDYEDETLKSFIKQQLKPLRNRINKRYRTALKGDLDDLHQLRIALKPLRYALDFFITILPSDKILPEYVAVLTAVRALGQVNDMAMATRILSGLTTADSRLQTAQAYMAGLQSAKLEEQRKIALRALK